MKVYRGWFEPVRSGNNRTWSRAHVHVFDAPADNDQPMVDLGPLTHHVKHSPDGFAWGYGGSGPAELARCILIDHLGVCSLCEGRGEVVYVEPDHAVRPASDDDPVDARGTCPTCWGERFAVTAAQYQAFKFATVGRWPQDSGWSITAHELDSWLAAGVDTETAGAR